MSVLKIPFSASIVWAVHICLTEPRPPAPVDEQVGPMGFEVRLMPVFVKVSFNYSPLIIMSSYFRPNRDASGF